MDQRLRKHQHDQRVQAEVKKIDQNYYKSELDVLKSTTDQRYEQDRAQKMVELKENQERQRILEEYNTLRKQEDLELKAYISTTNKQILDQTQAKLREDQLKNLLEDRERMKLLQQTDEED